VASSFEVNYPSCKIVRLPNNTMAYRCSSPLWHPYRINDVGFLIFISNTSVGAFVDKCCVVDLRHPRLVGFLRRN
jgi:hypothetical protein